MPVTFDHLNGALRDDVRRQQRCLERLVGHEASVMCGEGLRFGKFEVWLHLEHSAMPRDPRACAIRAVERALGLVGLAPTGDANGLAVVDSQIVVRG